MQTTEVLVGAKSLLIQHGWITGNFHRPDGYCLQGAVSDAARTRSQDDRWEPTWASRDASMALIDVMKNRGYDFALSASATTTSAGNVVAHWNDHYCQGLDDAIALIDDALLMLAPPAPPRQVTPAPSRGTYLLSTPQPPVTHTSLRERVRHLVGV